MQADRTIPDRAVTALITVILSPGLSQLGGRCANAVTFDERGNCWCLRLTRDGQIEASSAPTFDTAIELLGILPPLSWRDDFSPAQRAAISGALTHRTRLDAARARLPEPIEA